MSDNKIDLERYRDNDGVLDLRCVNLIGVNLEGVDLEGASLEGADLNSADLRGADLSCVNLERVDLRGADLRGADLKDVNLVGVDLREANLEGITGKDILTFQCGKHFAYCCDGYIKIGCECMSIDDWIERYKALGLSHGYTETQIKHYGNFIKYCKDMMRES